jgi:LmbE family N-acetylglucosaminyl deacetylase
VSARISPDQLVALRAAEARLACRALGLDEGSLRQLRWPPPLADRVGELAEAIVAAIREAKPQEVLVTSALDWHPDHQAVNQAARQAVARCAGDIGSTLLEYPVWHWADGPWCRDPARPLSRKVGDVVRDPWVSLKGPPPHLVRTGPYLLRKQAALASYRSQLENLTGEPTWAVLDDRFLRAFLRRNELFAPAG